MMTQHTVLIILSACLLLPAGSSGKIVVEYNSAENGRFPLEILVTMRQGTRGAMAKVANIEGRSRAALYAALRENADVSQAPLLEILNSVAAGIDARSFWISNQIYIRNADSVILGLLSEHQDVAGVDLVA